MFSKATRCETSQTSDRQNRDDGHVLVFCFQILPPPPSRHEGKIIPPWSAFLQSQLTRAQLLLYSLPTYVGLVVMSRKLASRFPRFFLLCRVFITTSYPGWFWSAHDNNARIGRRRSLDKHISEFTCIDSRSRCSYPFTTADWEKKRKSEICHWTHREKYSVLSDCSAIIFTRRFFISMMMMTEARCVCVWLTGIYT